jgi:hypothetical protein
MRISNIDLHKTQQNQNDYFRHLAPSVPHAKEHRERRGNEEGAR